MSRTASRVVLVGFWTCVGAVATLATALALGAADPRPLGALQWENRFVREGLWSAYSAAGANARAESGSEGLHMSLGGGDGWTAVVAASPAHGHTVELAGAQVEGEAAVAYGLALGWMGADDYTAVLINRDGYVRVEARSGGSRVELFEWQQWPHVLGGSQPNRIRADVHADGQVDVRINDERVVTFEAISGGAWGPIAFADGQTGQVDFYWAKLWSH